MQKWVSLKSVLSDVSDVISPQYFEEADIIEWSAIAMQKIQAFVNYDQAVTVLKVDNYKTCLPKGLIQIQMVACKNDFTLSEDDLKSLASDVGTDNPNYLAGFLNTPFYIRSFTPMRLATSPFANSLHCYQPNEQNPNNKVAHFYNKIEQEYTVHPNGTMTTSFKNGFVAIAYLQYPLDEEGNFLVPDDADMIDALTTYCMLRIWEKRWNMMEEGADSRMKWYSEKWKVLRPGVYGKFTLPSIDNLENIRTMRNRLIPVERQFSNFFGLLNVEESQRMGGVRENDSVGYYYNYYRA